jgi:hypothetical protein
MKTKSIAVALMFCFAGALLSLAQDAQLGSWKLNEAKSKFSAGSPMTTTSSYVADGDSIKVTLDGTGMDGKPSHTTWTGKFDGKDYPVTGDANQTMRSYTKVNDHSYKITVKSGDKTVLTGNITVSADGKTRTVKASGTAVGDKKFEYTAVYDKQ